MRQPECSLAAAVINSFIALFIGIYQVEKVGFSAP
jgi:hypothetical protein